MPNQTARRKSNPRVAQHAAERNRRHAIGFFVVAAQHVQRPPRWNAKRMAAAIAPEIAAEAPIIGNCSPGCVARCKSRPAGRPSPRRRRESAARRSAAPPRCRRAAAHTALTPKWSPVGMDQRIGDEGPDLGAETALQRATEHDLGVVARRDEGKGKQELDVLIVAQQQRAHSMQQRQHGQQSDDDGRNIEQRFAFQA